MTATAAGDLDSELQLFWLNLCWTLFMMPALLHKLVLW